MAKAIFMLSVLLLFIASPVRAEVTVAVENLPPSFQATYTLFRKGLAVAENEYKFDKNSSSALLSSKTRLTGLSALFSDQQVNESSEMLFSNGQVQVIKYNYHQTGKDARTTTVTINPELKTFTVRENNLPQYTSEYQGSLWDNLSIFTTLMSIAALDSVRDSRQNSDNNHESEYVISSLDDDKIKQYVIKPSAQREIELDDDEWVMTDVWKRQHKNKIILFYLDPASYFLPVKIEQYKNDKLKAMLLLSEINWK